nr:MAG TPA: hypothetical protein [Caudoviricetes sp.]
MSLILDAQIPPLSTNNKQRSPPCGELEWIKK